MGFLQNSVADSKKIRRVIVIGLLIVAKAYYGCLALMHYFSPFPDVLPLLLIAFTLPLLAALATVHLVHRLDHLAIPLAVLLVLMALPVLVVGHNFLDGLVHLAKEFLTGPLLPMLLGPVLRVGIIYCSVHSVITVLIAAGAFCLLAVRLMRRSSVDYLPFL